MIDQDSGTSYPFDTVTSTILGCTPVYDLYRYDISTSQYITYFDSNPSIENVELLPIGTSDLYDKISLNSVEPDDTILDNMIWDLRITVTSEPLYSAA